MFVLLLHSGYDSQVMRVSACLCLSMSISQDLHVQSYQILVRVAYGHRLASGSVAIDYLVLVLWMM